ncbi:acyl-CoA thioesterase II [Oligella ureolytica]
MNILDRLVSQLALEQVDEMRYVGRSTDIFLSGRVFGGQVLGQALMAANYTTPDDRFAHSMHAYFVRAADASLPIEYAVENIRDGGSFSVRRVKCQPAGQVYFYFVL